MENKMTDQEIRHAIAKMMGWEWSLEGHWKNKKWPGHKYHEPPDYLNDLNAMHEAEKVLTRDQWETYLQRIWSVCSSTSEDFVIAHATAKQRAEAFCRTLYPERFKE